MPRFDRTGPEGKGSQTGRRMGKCNPENDSSTNNTFFGRGFGRRFSREQDAGNGGRGGRRQGKGPGRA